MRLENRQLREALAGEYVLGTLRGPARRRFEHYLADSAELRAEVAFWERALAPLAASEAQAPSRNLLPAIEARLGWDERPAESARKLPWLPSLAFALVAGFSILLWAPWEARLVPDFAMDVATEEGTLRWQFAVDRTHDWIELRVVDTPDLDPDQDLELWLLVDNAAPISLGLLPEQEGQVQRIEAGVSLSGGQGLAVSVEPAGGSPTGAPTGPVIAAQMFPSA